MLTIERNLVSELKNEDIAVFSEINTGLKYYKAYFQRLTWFKSGLIYSEYYTLYIDFYCFYNEIHLNCEKVELYKINSFIRSFKILLKKIELVNESPESMFRSFLIDSICAMALILESLLEVEN